MFALLKLAHASPALVAPACAVWELFVRLLSRQTLRAYLSSIVVTLSTVADQRDSWTPLAHQALRIASRATARPVLARVHPQFYADCDKLVLAELGRWRDASGVQRVVLRPVELGGAVFNAFGAPLPPSLGVWGRAQLSSGALSGADMGYRRAVSTGSVAASVIVQRILTYLLVERREDLAPAIADLPGCNLLPPLRPFVKVCQRRGVRAVVSRQFRASLSQGIFETGTKEKAARTSAPVAGAAAAIVIDANEAAFDDAMLRLPKLCALLSNDSEQVQDLVLQDLSQVLQANATLMHARLLVSGGSDVVMTVVTQLLSKLLDISRKSSSSSVRQRCALCLGQLGAVDPSRVSPSAPHEQVWHVSLLSRKRASHRVLPFSGRRALRSAPARGIAADVPLESASRRV